MNTIWQFATAGSIKFGRGSRRLLIDEIRRFGVQQPLVVTDNTLCGLDRVQEIIDWIASAFGTWKLFKEVQPEPTVEMAKQAIVAGREIHADCIVGVGGGSDLDVAKITAAVLSHGGQPEDYFGFDKVPGPLMPVFALPTTPGTGSEVSHSAVLTDTANQMKVSTLSRWLRPSCAIVDPALTDTCPPSVTGASGIDALVHAIESYTNRGFQEMENVDPQVKAYEGSYRLTGLLASEAIRLIGRSLVTACCDGKNTEARDEMALAAMLAGMAFSNSGVAIVHALEYPIGALTHCSHGEGNGLLLPHVMRFNLPERMIEFTDIARWLGQHVAGLSLRESAEKAVEAVIDLQQHIGIRTRLRELGMQQSDIPEVAAKALSIRRLMDINPVTPQLPDLESILAAAF